MRLTTFTDYTLRVLIYLGSHPDRRTTIGEVAEAFRISEHHVAKVVHFLGAAGWLENIRGRGGGMRLALPASQVNIGDVVRLAEGRDVPAECFEPGGNECTLVRDCRLKNALAEAVQAFYETLSRYSLEDLVGKPELVARVLVTPAARPREAAKESASK